jgi:hypothetical protein
MDSGSRITGGGSGYAALLAHAEGALYGTELGSVTLKRIGLFCFPIKHSTHTPHFPVSGETRIESPANFDDHGYASATCPRPEVRATAEAP